MRPRIATMWVCVMVLTIGHALSIASETQSRNATVERLAFMEKYFESHPELKTTPGSGWNPYNRVKWFREQRMVDGRFATPRQLWNAWEAKQDILRERGRALGGNTWFSLGPVNYSGRILQLAFDPTNTDILYVGSASGGLWKSTDHGLTYTALTDELPSLAIGGLCVLPWNTDVILIGTGEGAFGVSYAGVGILKSTDAGVTWNTTDFIRGVASDHGFHVMAANPTTHTILAGATDGLWRSTDDGDTWVDVRTGGNFYDVVWKPGDPNRVYTCKGRDTNANNVKVSTDDGLTWTRAGTGQPPSDNIGKTKLAVSAAQPAWIYALYAGYQTAPDRPFVYRSTDDGATWQDRSGDAPIGGGQGNYNLTLALDPDDANTVLAAGVNLYRSTDGALTFTNPFGEAVVHTDHHAITYEPGTTNTVWVGTDGGVWRNDTDGNFWQSSGDRSPGLVTYQFYDICVNNHAAGPYYALGGTQDQGTDKWSGTTTWEQGLGAASGADGMVCMIDPQIGTTVFAERQNGATFRNMNSGDGLWNGVSFPGTKIWVNPWAEAQNDGDILLAGSDLGIHKSTDAGSNWTNVSPHTATWIDFHDLNDDVAWTVEGGTAFVTTDGGATWTESAAFGDFLVVAEPTKILPHPVDQSTALVTFSGLGPIAHVGMTTDLGSSWADVTGDFPSQPVNAIAIDPDSLHHWYIGTDLGVWLSTNDGTNWLPCDVALPNVIVSDLEVAIHERKLVAGTYGRGMWEMDLPAPVGVGEPQIAGARPIMLDAPRPNPAQSGTMLRWAAYHDGPVELVIYDVTGRRVESLYTLSRGDGLIRETGWNAEQHPSGVYFAVVSAGDERISRKIVLTR